MFRSKPDNVLINPGSAKSGWDTWLADQHLSLAKAAPGECIDKNEQYLGHAPAKSADASAEAQDTFAAVNSGAKDADAGNS